MLPAPAAVHVSSTAKSISFPPIITTARCASHVRRGGHRQVREELRAVRGLRPEDPRPVSDARGRLQLARAVPRLRNVRRTAEQFVLCAQRQAVLQAGLRQVRAPAGAAMAADSARLCLWSNGALVASYLW